MRLPLRFIIFLRWFQNQTRAVETRPPFGESLRELLALPNSMGGKRFIRSVEEDGEFVRVHLTKHDYPLYWPKNIGLGALQVVLNETFQPNHWHAYEYAGTRLRPDDVIVDAGAAEGLFALLNAPRCQKIYAVEPLPTFNRALAKTLAHLANVEVINALAGRESGETYITEGGISTHRSESGDVIIPIITLDERFHDQGIPVSYLKADIEGAEMEFLEGGRRLITANKPRVAITTYHNRDHAQQIAEFLRSIHPQYKVVTKGLSPSGAPVMLHAWCE